jgi:hypothetical protein
VGFRHGLLLDLSLTSRSVRIHELFAETVKFSRKRPSAYRAIFLSNRTIRWNGGDRPQIKRDTGPRRSERRPLWRLFVSEKNNRYTTPFRRKEKASDFSVKKDTKIGKPNGKISTSGRHTHIASFTIDPYDSAKLASGDQAEQERQHPLLSQRYLR